MSIGTSKQGAGKTVPAFPAPQGAWHVPGTLYLEWTARVPAPQVPSDGGKNPGAGRAPGTHLAPGCGARGTGFREGARWTFSASTCPELGASPCDMMGFDVVVSV